jgi:hypothetical protein
VYGDVRAGVLQPLDGQQRLTTLFLLHWYVASRADKLDPSAVGWASLRDSADSPRIHPDMANPIQAGRTLHRTGSATSRGTCTRGATTRPSRRCSSSRQDPSAARSARR